jgi:hypothetical protein
MLHLPPAHHKTSKHNFSNKTKIKEKQNETIPDLNSSLAKSMTHHNQTKELTTWFLNIMVITWLGSHFIMRGSKRSNLRKKQLVLIAKGILKLDDSERKTLRG